eukprot:2763497-Prorocentrum_lima.AAC.1
MNEAAEELWVSGCPIPVCWCRAVSEWTMSPSKAKIDSARLHIGVLTSTGLPPTVRKPWGFEA